MPGFQLEAGKGEIESEREHFSLSASLQSDNLPPLTGGAVVRSARPIRQIPSQLVVSSVSSQR